MIKKYTSENGMRAVLNPMPYMKSVSIGIFIKSGSVYETPQNNGIAHFIEHMLFKGTTKRSAGQISHESDELGGALNAYTAEECTCIYIKVLASDIENALDLLFDIAFDPVFDEDAIENEKKVILEEISGAEDNPEDAAQEMLMANMFESHPVGMPVLGNAENVMSFTRDDIYRFYKERFVPQNMLISVAGCFNEEHVQTLISAKTEAYKRNEGFEASFMNKATVHGGIYKNRRDIGQLQLVAGYPCVSRFDDRLCAFIFLSSILSGDSSSRLFRRLRDENGLVYGVDATVMEYDNTGVFMISTGFSPENADKVISIIREEINDILVNGISEEELRRTRRSLVTGLELDAEGTMSLMSLEGKRELYNIKYDAEGMKHRYLNITANDVLEAAKYAFTDGKKEAVAIIGDYDEDTDFRIINTKEGN